MIMIRTCECRVWVHMGMSVPQVWDHPNIMCHVCGSLNHEADKIVFNFMRIAATSTTN